MRDTTDIGYTWRMPTPAQLLARLADIARSLERSGHAIALIGLGSVGAEIDRLDAYSDLDFFAVVAPGYKQFYLSDLAWLSSIHPIAYHFFNTADGCKLLFADGVFCEFAVFEPHELSRATFANARVIWQTAEFDEALAAPAASIGSAAPRSVEWLIGETLTNLHVGLGRYRRGEKLSAQRFIQHYAVDRVIELAALMEPAQGGGRDPFAAERRFEQRYPHVARELSRFVPGYDRSVESAAAILAYLEAHFPINAAMAQAIRNLMAEVA